MAPLALVYRGRAARPAACSEAVAELLGSSPRGFDVAFVGPRQELRLTPDNIARAVLYAQPGGGELRPSYRRMRRSRDTIRDYVAAGGRYLGFCLGGYLAGATPGFDLLPGDTDQYVSTAGAEVTDTGDTVVEVAWRGTPRRLYFQDGPVFQLRPQTARRTTVLARYSTGGIAAFTSAFGRGRVGGVGPHPEAPPAWFRDARLPVVPSGADLGHDLIDEVLR